MSTPITKTTVLSGQTCGSEFSINAMVDNIPVDRRKPSASGDYILAVMTILVDINSMFKDFFIHGINNVQWFKLYEQYRTSHQIYKCGKCKTCRSNGIATLQPSLSDLNEAYNFGRYLGKSDVLSFEPHSSDKSNTDIIVKQIKALVPTLPDAEHE